uniref:Retinol dehydrogenase 12-like n=1 Tax=Phallusia mammillata TaxID=59560 RepID=A0A6F9DBH3_9ASCI|nr:retinol dehydrogenase 12-like [Phallusia mammillata]
MNFVSINRIWMIILVYLIGLKVCCEQLLYKYVFHTSSRPTELHVKKCDGLTAIVTGGSSGIGLAVVKKLHKLGYTVISCASTHNPFLHCEVKQIELDLSSLPSVKKFAHLIMQQNTQIDLLVNCAGVMFVPETNSKQGIEYHMATNYLGHFLLTLLLLPALKKSKQCCVINVTSSTSSIINSYDFKSWFRPPLGSYIPESQYARSKLALIIFTYKLQKHLKLSAPSVQVLAYDPGTVKTQLYKHSGKLTTMCMQLLGCILLRVSSDVANDITEVLHTTLPNGICMKGWKRKYEKTKQFTYLNEVQDQLWNQSILEVEGFL